MKNLLLIATLIAFPLTIHSADPGKQEFHQFNQLPKELRQIIIASLESYDLPEAIRKI